jgi:retron-type reverse transcriptase
MNRSFGFRPNKGTLDAITALIPIPTSTATAGMRTALEGDQKIEAAYDTVGRDKLLEQLGKRIIDRKFLKLISERLEYDYVPCPTLLKIPMYE